MTDYYSIAWGRSQIMRLMNGWKRSIEFLMPQEVLSLLYVTWSAYCDIWQTMTYATVPLFVGIIALVQPFFGKGADPISILPAGIISGMYLLIARPTVMQKRYYFSPKLFFRETVGIIRSIWYGYILPVFQNVQSSQSARFFVEFLGVDIVLVAIIAWLLSMSFFVPHIVQYIVLISGPLFPGYQVMHTSPLFVFACMSVLDAGYHLRDIFFAPLRAFMMILYNYPLCTILFWLCNGVQLAVHYITPWYYLFYYVEVFLIIPCFICLWVNLYIMFVHKQFKVYYDVPG